MGSYLNLIPSLGSLRRLTLSHSLTPASTAPDLTPATAYRDHSATAEHSGHRSTSPSCSPPQAANRMKIVPDLYRSVNNALSRQSRLARSLSTQSTKDSFERRVLGGDGLSSKSSDGMDSMLEKAAEEDFSFRDNMLAKENLFGTTYRAPGGTDLRRQASRPYSGKKEFETTTEEVLRNADFRNVRFLANFITEAGLIIKRSQTNISAKAQRKVAREIKTARVLGLMPFVTMGTKPFVFGQSMNDRDGDYQI